ncbi:hypothetical protein LTR17_001420 [Elasticomyces elasticus]|nr:hypothetical protein LTR17_001420 [Elasticomyces elasticus]
MPRTFMPRARTPSTWMYFPRTSMPRVITPRMSIPRTKQLQERAPAHDSSLNYIAWIPGRSLIGPED